MNRNLIIVQIVIWALIALALVAVLFSGVIGRGLFFNVNLTMGGNMKQVFEKSLSVNGVNDISLDLRSMDVTFEASDNDEIRIVQYAAGNLAEKDLIKVEQTGSSISVKQPFMRGFFLFQMPNPQRLTVYLPASYKQALTVNSTSGNVKFKPELNLTSLDMNLTSGNIYSDMAITVKDLSVNMTSGDMGVYTITCDRYEIVSTSGNMRGGSLTGNGSIRLVSGDIGFETISGSETELQTTSGNIRVKAFSGKAKIRAISGNIDVAFMAPLAEITADASSGNIDLTLPEGAAADIKASCGSGNIRGNVGFSYDEKGKHATATLNGGGVSVSASAGSGNINITQD